MSFLLVDKILKLTPGEYTLGVKTIGKNYLHKNATERGYFIPTLIGETLGQLTAWNVMQTIHFTKRPVAGVVRGATVHRHVYPGDTLIFESFIDELDNESVLYHGNVKIDDEKVFTLTQALGPLLPMNDFINETEIKKQFKNLISKDNILIDKSNIAASASTDFDSIVEHDFGKMLVAEKTINADEPFFQDHFPNKPVLPMTILLEYIRNLAEVFFKKANFTNDYQLHELYKVKMSDFINPDDKITCILKLKSHTDEKVILNVTTKIDKKRVCTTEAHFAVRI